MLMQSLSNKDGMRLLHNKHIVGLFKDGKLLHHIAAFREPEMMKMILGSVSEDQQRDLLSVQSIVKVTTVHWACRYNRPDVLEVIIKMTSSPIWYKLLQIPEWVGTHLYIVQRGWAIENASGLLLTLSMLVSVFTF